MTQGPGLSGADPDQLGYRQRNWEKREGEREQTGFVCKKKPEALKVKWARESPGKVLPLVECGPENVLGTNQSDELLPFLWAEGEMWGAGCQFPFLFSIHHYIRWGAHQVEIDCFADYLITGSL